MEQTNGTTNKKRVLFSIGSYNDKEKKVINKISTNGLFTSPSTSPEPPKTLLRDKPIKTVDTTDMVQKFNTLPSRSKNFKFSMQNGQSDLSHVSKPACPPSKLNDRCSMIVENESRVDKPNHPPMFNRRSMSLEPEQLRQSGKVALTIASYEGEPKTPTRLEFLPQTRHSRSSSKANSEISLSIEDSEPIGSRLQNELVATLKRSNLKRRSDIPEQANGQVNSSENGDHRSSEQSKEEHNTTNGNVKQLATALGKMMTFNGPKSDN